MAVVFFIFLSSFSLAASGGEIPFNFISFQAFNFLIFLGIIIYFILKKIPQILKTQNQKYIEAKKSSESLLKKALSEKKNLQKKISAVKKREKNFDEELQESLERIEKEMTQQTKQQCSFILDSAQRFVDQERAKLKRKLGEDLLDQVEYLSKENLKSSDQENFSSFKKINKNMGAL